MSGGDSENGQVRGFWHVGVVVEDLDRSLRFYRDGIGLEVRSRSVTSAAAPEVWNEPGAHADVAFLGPSGGPEVLELLALKESGEPAATPRVSRGGTAHLCLEVDDLSGLHDRLTTMGYRSLSDGPVEVPSGVLAGGRAVYMVDPDRFLVELVERPTA